MSVSVSLWLHSSSLSFALSMTLSPSPDHDALEYPSIFFPERLISPIHKLIPKVTKLRAIVRDLNKKQSDASVSFLSPLFSLSVSLSLSLSLFLYRLYREVELQKL